jgi:acetyl-CoA acetyltransferase family protein
MADRFGVERPELDAYAVESHRRAAAATDAGAFDREIFAVAAGGIEHMRDQGIRPDTSVEALAGLGPVFGLTGGKITAGNSSPISDGAAAVLLASADKAHGLGLRPRAQVVDQVVLGTDPVAMLEGPIPATRKLLRRNGLQLDDVDVIEINEAFACQVLAVGKELDWDWNKVNPNGGAVALGHPLGASGTRLLGTIAYEMDRQDAEWGLVTLCMGAGMGMSVALQREHYDW